MYTHIKTNKFLMLIMVFVLFGLISESVFAADVSGGEMPWDGAMGKVLKSLTGPFAFGLAVIGVVSTGTGLIFGADIGSFFKGIIILVLVCSLIVSSVNLISVLFGTGAQINQTEIWHGITSSSHS